MYSLVQHAAVAHGSDVGSARSARIQRARQPVCGESSRGLTCGLAATQCSRSHQVELPQKNPQPLNSYMQEWCEHTPVNNCTIRLNKHSGNYFSVTTKLFSDFCCGCFRCRSLCRAVRAMGCAGGKPAETAAPPAPDYTYNEADVKVYTCVDRCARLPPVRAPEGGCVWGGEPCVRCRVHSMICS